MKPDCLRYNIRWMKLRFLHAAACCTLKFMRRQSGRFICACMSIMRTVPGGSRRFTALTAEIRCFAAITLSGNLTMRGKICGCLLFPSGKTDF